MNHREEASAESRRCRRWMSDWSYASTDEEQQDRLWRRHTRVTGPTASAKDQRQDLLHRVWIGVIRTSSTQGRNLPTRPGKYCLTIQMLTSSGAFNLRCLQVQVLSTSGAYKFRCFQPQVLTSLGAQVQVLTSSRF